MPSELLQSGELDATVQLMTLIAVVVGERFGFSIAEWIEAVGGQTPLDEVVHHSFGPTL